MKKEKVFALLDFLPLCILVVYAIILISSVVGTDMVLTWRNIVALVVLPVNLILFFWKHRVGVLFCGLILVLGLFHKLSYTPGIGNSTLEISWLGASTGDFNFQPIFLLWLLIFFIISGRHFVGIGTNEYWQKLFSKSLCIVLTAFFSMSLSAQSTALRPGVVSIVDKLREEKEVHFGYPVGVAGRPETGNKYYKLYLKLKDRATDEELIQLTRDSSACIVVYSFDILWQRQNTAVKEIFLQHQNDTAFFWTAAGCTGTLDRVNWFMLRRLKPGRSEGSKDILTKDEYELYCKKFSKTDGLFTCN